MFGVPTNGMGVPTQAVASKNLPVNKSIKPNFSPLLGRYNDVPQLLIFIERRLAASQIYVYL